MNILIVDDDPDIRESLKMGLTMTGHDTVCCENGMIGLEKVEAHNFDVILLDVRLPDLDGFQLLKKFREVDSTVPIIMMTAHSSVESAVEAMKQGAYHYIKKPFTIDEIELLVKRATEYAELKVANRCFQREMEEKYNFLNIVGKNIAIRKLFELVRAIARSRSTVLIRGETGTGKELIAKAIHYQSEFAEGPFVTINCAALPRELLESELFGYEPGAFTDARRRMLGKFEVAHNGTILLDEIAEMDVQLQAKLLRVLQEGEFYRIGGNQLIRVNARVIATTNRDIEEEVRKGRFRDDLYYRLNIIPVVVPPLRERKDDIPLLTEHFVQKYSMINRKHSFSVLNEAYQKLMEHSWPGNVRELENCIERAIVVAKTDMLSPDDFVITPPTKTSRGDMHSLLTTMTIRDMEKKMILTTLKHHDDNRTKSAHSLGISVRTLRNKLNEYSLCSHIT
jgi:DNA-binding NtrC family response regulator